MEWIETLFMPAPTRKWNYTFFSFFKNGRPIASPGTNCFTWNQLLHLWEFTPRTIGLFLICKVTLSWTWLWQWNGIFEEWFDSFERGVQRGPCRMYVEQCHAQSFVWMLCIVWWIYIHATEYKFFICVFFLNLNVFWSVRTIFHHGRV